MKAKRCRHTPLSKLKPSTINATKVVLEEHECPLCQAQVGVSFWSLPTEDGPGAWKVILKERTASKTKSAA